MKTHDLARSMTTHRDDDRDGARLLPPRYGIGIADGGVVQAKLHVSDPHDLPEREAVRIADLVMRMPDSGLGPLPRPSPSTSLVQRKCAACEEDEPNGLVQRAEEAGASIRPGTAAAIDGLRGERRAAAAYRASELARTALRR